MNFITIFSPILIASNLIFVHQGDVKNRFCSVDPNKIDLKIVTDSINTFCDRDIKMINDNGYQNKSFHIYLNYHYCESNSKKDVETLKKTSEKLLPVVKKKFKYLKTKDFRVEDAGKYHGIPFGSACENYVGIRLVLTVDE